MSDGRGGNKLLFWLVRTPRRIRINCCFIYSDDDANNDNERDDANNARTSSTNQSRAAARTAASKRNGDGGNGGVARRRIRREDIGLPSDFKHLQHLGPDDPALSNARQLSIVCSNF